jgi:DNA-nicking Smr family endonuclease
MKSNLDLHGVRHSEVPREVDKFIGEHLMGGTKSVIIVTGNSKRMKAIVSNTLSDYSMNYVENPLNSGEVSVYLS